MRYRLILTSLVLAVTSYGAELRIESGIAAASGPVTLNVNLTAASDALTGIQFDLEYDASALNVTVEAGPAAAKANKSVQTSILEKARQRVLIIGFNRDSIPDGTVAILHVSVKPNVDAPARGYPIKLTALAGTNGKAENVVVVGHDAPVRIPAVGNLK